jgi:hypothetical protein
MAPTTFPDTDTDALVTRCTTARTRRSKQRPGVPSGWVTHIIVA